MRNLDNSKPTGSGAAPPGAAGAVAPHAPGVSGGPGVAQSEVKRPAGNRDGLVLVSIAAVSVALVTMFTTQLSMPLASASLYGAVAWAAFMLVHKLVQKSAQVTQLRAELARARGSSQRPRQVARTTPASPLETAAATTIDARASDPGAALQAVERVPATPVHSAAETPTPTTDYRPPQWQTLGAGPPPDLSSNDGFGRRHRTELPPLLGAEPDASKAAPQPEPIPPPSVTLAVPTAPAFASPAAEAAPSPAGDFQPDPLRDQWSFRPRHESRAAQTGGPSAPSLQGSDRPAASLTIEGDLDLVQRKIRELADEVNASDTLRSSPALRPDTPIKSKADALEDSIGALKAAASTMRDRGLSDYVPALDPGNAPRPAGPSTTQIKSLGDLVIPATAKRIAGSEDRALDTPISTGRREPIFPDLPIAEFPPAPPLVTPSPAGSSLAAAIESDAIKVTLAPIVTLASHTVGHYEMAAEIKFPDEQLALASEQDLAKLDVEMAARFDIGRLNRAAALSLRMETRDKDGALLTAFMGSSFSSRPFLEALAGAYEVRQRIAAQLVPVLSQQSMEAFTPAAWQALRDMHAFGFRFALDGVTNVTADFATLALAGFRFVRLDARVLLDGIMAADRFVTADEIRQRVALAGLTVIAGGVNDARLQAKLLEAGIELGQGSLFGAARDVNLQDGASAHRSAA